MDASDPYARSVEAAQALITRAPAVVADMLNHSNFLWAAQNCRTTANAFVDIGLLHWRHGIDPRADFRGAMNAYDRMGEIVSKHRLPKTGFEFPMVYAAMSLLGRNAPIEYFDEAACEQSRWRAYEYRLVHALLDQEPSPQLAAMVDRNLETHNDLPDRIFDTYFQLLGLRPAKLERDEMVRRAKSTWVERRRDEHVSIERPMDGHGAMNDLYVDIYLAAVLRKIGWVGTTVHAWIWD